MTAQDSTLQRAGYCTAFLEQHAKHRSKIRELSKAASKNLLTAHQFAFSAVISYQNRIQGRKYEAHDPSIKGRMGLIAQFIQGVEITETAISEGLYANAANLLKQELETLGAIEEFEVNERRDRKVPSFRGRLSGFGRLYGDFNDVAHPTRQEIVESLTTFSEAERYGPTTIPQFNKELYQMLYGNQAMFLVILLSQMQPVFLEVFGLDWNEEETHLASSAVRILIDEGIIKEHNTG